MNELHREKAVLQKSSIHYGYRVTGEWQEFFYGGVDAWSSLMTYIKEKPMLFSVWGADIP